MVRFVTVWFISYIKLLLCRQTATSFSYSELLKWLLRPEANDIVHINIYQLPPSNRNVCLYLLFWPANSQKPELFSPQIKICTNVKLEPFHPKNTTTTYNRCLLTEREKLSEYVRGIKPAEHDGVFIFSTVCVMQTKEWETLQTPHISEQ